MRVIVGTALITAGVGVVILICAVRSMASGGRLALLRVKDAPQSDYDKVARQALLMWPLVVALWRQGEVPLFGIQLAIV